jgi:hypothetical protein
VIADNRCIGVIMRPVTAEARAPVTISLEELVVTPLRCVPARTTLQGKLTLELVLPLQGHRRRRRNDDEINSAPQQSGWPNRKRSNGSRYAAFLGRCDQVMQRIKVSNLIVVMGANLFVGLFVVITPEVAENEISYFV